MSAWWQSLAPRERWMVLLAVLVTVCMSYYGMVWQPLNERSARDQQQVTKLQEQLAWMKGARQRIQEQGGASTSSSNVNRNRSVLAITDETANRFQLKNAVKRINPEGNDGVSLEMDRVDYQALIRWLGHLQQEHGIALQRLRLNKDADGLNARITLERPAA